MLYSYEWLKQFTDTSLPADELADRLTMAGIEVEVARSAGEQVKGVVTAEVIEIEKHPNADRLLLCKVNTGSEVVTVVCGAKNVSSGDKVALALPGATLAGGARIKKSRIRGVESNGMICSATELGLKETSEGVMILPPGTEPGSSAEEVLGLGDTLLEAFILPNRPDLLSIRGLAREISAVTGGKFTDQGRSLEEDGAAVQGRVTVEIESLELCRRYTARLIEGVTVGPSPEWLVRRLEAHGLRSVNNVVDATNYVLIELGQPLHCFDLDKLHGPAIIIRAARDNETMVTIDGEKRALPEGACLICDSKAPVAIAGIMGGGDSAVSDGTVNVLLESASFDPAATRRASRALGLSTDSSFRFERGVDIESVLSASASAAALIVKLAGGKVSEGVIDVYPGRAETPEVELRVGRAGSLLGLKLSTKEVEKILVRLGLGVRPGSKKGTLMVAPPSYRIDLKLEEDLVEEIARLKGYDTIPAELPETSCEPLPPGSLYDIRKTVVEILVGCGFFEAINYSFVSEDSPAAPGEPTGEAVTIINPLTEQQGVLRRSLVPSLLTNLVYNLDRKNDEVKIFEFRPVFSARTHGDEKGLPVERWKVAGLIYGTRRGRGWNVPTEPVDFYDIKGVCERLAEALGKVWSFEPVPEGFAGGELVHPGKSAVLVSDGLSLGYLGELHPGARAVYGLNAPAYVFEIDVEALEPGPRREKSFEQIPKYPESTRDIAFIIDDSVPFSEVKSAIDDLGIKFIEKVDLFDVYYGKNIPSGKKSIALRVVYRSRETTLKYGEVEDLHRSVSEELSRRFGADIRM